MSDRSDELYKRLLQPIDGQMIRTVARIVRDPEESADVFQDVLVTVWHKLDHILNQPNPQGYILRICITRSYDALRRKMRRRRFEIRLESIKARFRMNAVAEASAFHITAETVRAAISMLPPKQGQAVLLRAVEGVPYDAMATILGCAETTARSHFSKGRAQLERILLRHGGRY